MRLTRRYRFCASHRLNAQGLSEAENRALYGKCNNPYGHGHDYVLEVSVRGTVDAKTGRIADLGALDALVQSKVLEAFDHRNLNIEVPELAGVVPTTENLVSEIERRLRVQWPEGVGRLDRIRVQETKRNVFTAGCGNGEHEE